MSSEELVDMILDSIFETNETELKNWIYVRYGVKIE
jgi:hypothetical protein